MVAKTHSASARLDDTDIAVDVRGGKPRLIATRTTIFNFTTLQNYSVSSTVNQYLCP